MGTHTFLEPLPVLEKGVRPVCGTDSCTGCSMVHQAFSLVFRAAFGAVLLSLAVPAEATLYKWVDQKGKVTYSNLPPAEGVDVRELETIDENRAPTAVELRTRQILEEAARERRATGGVDLFHVPATASGRTAAGSAEIDAGVRYEWVPQGAPPAANRPRTIASTARDATAMTVWAEWAPRCCPKASRG